MRAVVIFTLIFILISQDWLHARQRSCSAGQASKSAKLVDLGQEGILEGFTREKDQFILRQYHPGGKALWEVQLQLASGRSVVEMVASPASQDTFVLDFTPSLRGPGTLQIHHVQSGTVRRSLSVEDQQQLMGESLHAVFADDSYLYFLTAEHNPDKFRLLKGQQMNYLLNRFRIADFFFDQVRLALPEAGESDQDPKWTFAGQVGQEKYMVLKDVDLQTNMLRCQIAAFDAGGRITRKINLNYAPKDHAIRPSLHVDDNDRRFLLAKDYNYPGYSSFGPFPSAQGFGIGAYFGLRLDEQTGAFYISGLSGNESFGKNPFHFKAQQYSGFYLSKFNADGQLIWESGHRADGKIIAEEDFQKRVRPVNKQSGIALAAETGEIHYAIRIGSSSFGFVLDEEEGELMAVNGMPIQRTSEKTLTSAETNPVPVSGKGLFQMIEPAALAGKEQKHAARKPGLTF
ncbi:hypothetical protein SAMN04488057_10191 [Cyclobacterium lianum]|uniref:Uncharacterized protein n=1 Tax=Cyclobacterium lianum TaxID=388280 RepID=A0A1M7HWQ4_9BACT|nr:hypothetical protein [Cyclobacterium lianum]SHM32890.1 hypothetical protein SAMN04488057_10191 [Cyclobacterium lianum]